LHYFNTISPYQCPQKLQENQHRRREEWRNHIDSNQEQSHYVTSESIRKALNFSLGNFLSKDWFVRSLRISKLISDFRVVLFPLFKKPLKRILLVCLKIRIFALFMLRELLLCLRILNLHAESGARELRRFHRCVDIV